MVRRFRGEGGELDTGWRGHLLGWHYTRGVPSWRGDLGG
jgi:hypothetical protein